MLIEFNVGGSFYLFEIKGRRVSDLKHKNNLNGHIKIVRHKRQNVY